MNNKEKEQKVLDVFIELIDYLECDEYHTCYMGNVLTGEPCRGVTLFEPGVETEFDSFDFRNTCEKEQLRKELLPIVQQALKEDSEKVAFYVCKDNLEVLLENIKDEELEEEVEEFADLHKEYAGFKIYVGWD